MSDVYYNENSFVKLTADYETRMKSGTCVEENVAKYHELCNRYGKQNFDLLTQIRERVEGFDLSVDEREGWEKMKQYAYHCVILWIPKRKIIDCSNGRQEMTDIQYWWAGRRQWQMNNCGKHIFSKFIRIRNLQEIDFNEMKLEDVVYSLWKQLDKCSIEKLNRVDSVTVGGYS
tara:strand:- start:359 stop:880 length:522 start_codon:yes stop_codon:yes gene_type:complete